jgi:dTDP-4-dehydrorhamnose 3,5-epimerase
MNDCSEAMKVTATALPEVKLIAPKVFGDARGFFYESWNARDFAEAGIDTGFVQDNHSRSARGVLRGLHYQLSEPQGKLVRVIQGSVYDVVVDIRKSSPDFGKWIGIELTAESKNSLWVPPGFAHGFLVLSDTCEFLYKATAYYAPMYERSILWSDPDLGISWPMTMEPVLSAKDSGAPRLRDAEVYS